MFQGINISEIVITMLGTILASSGFWIWFQKRLDVKSSNSKLLMGLASFRIVNSGMEYIRRGYITKDEYEVLHDLYIPYKEMGGNGMAHKVMCTLETLPFEKDMAEKNKKLEECK